MYKMLQYSHPTLVSHDDDDDVVVPKRISLTLSRHFSLSFIASGRSSGLHPVLLHSCCMYVRAGCPAFAWPYVGVHRSTSLMSLFLLLQQCPACLVVMTSRIKRSHDRLILRQNLFPAKWKEIIQICLSTSQTLEIDDIGFDF